MKSIYTTDWMAGILLAAFVLFPIVMISSCGENNPNVGDPCDATDESFCKSDSVAMECSHVTRDRRWIEILCDEFCASYAEGRCIEDEQGARCECTTE